MREYLKFYIDGQWVDPVEPKTADVVNPATEEVSGRISLGSVADIDKAVAAARRAFAMWSETSVADRLDLLKAIKAEYERRSQELERELLWPLLQPRSLSTALWPTSRSAQGRASG